jgi:hypothetical protein
MGDTGAQGPQGFQGEKGDIGETGAQGPQGFQGEKGDKGDMGDTGAQGPQGDTGPAGPQGFQGNDGVTGPQGPQGFQGVTGPSVPWSPSFINVLSTQIQNIATEQPVFFDQVTEQMGSIWAIPNTSQVYLTQPGYNHAIATAHHIEACQFSYFLNGAIYGFPFSSATGATIIIHPKIIHIRPNDLVEESPFGLAAVLQFVNHTSYIPVIRLNDTAGSAPNDASFAMTVFQLA